MNVNMKKIRQRFLLAFVGVQLLLYSNISNSNDNQSIVGNWLCEGFMIKDKYFTAKGIGEISYFSSYKNSSHLRYSFDFGDNKTLNLDIHLFGIWGHDDNGFWDKLDKSKVSIIMNNLNLKDEEIQTIVDKYFSGKKEFHFSVKFINNDKFEIRAKNNVKPIACIRDTTNN